LPSNPGSPAHFRLARQFLNQAYVPRKRFHNCHFGRYIERMPIRPFLAGQAFEPELIQEMSLALEHVCAKLVLPLADDSNTRLVASKIIELAQRSVKDAPTLTTMTLKEFKHY
jgi:hypothetical protein